MKTRFGTPAPPGASAAASGTVGAVARIGLIGLAGAAGALSCYAIGVAPAGRLYPYGTSAINVIGSFLLGLLLGGPGATRWSETTMLAISVGFLGAFTTFSTFTNETMDLLRDGRPTAAFVVRVLSLALGLTAAAIGWTVGRELADQIPRRCHGPQMANDIPREAWMLTNSVSPSGLNVAPANSSLNRSAPVELRGG